MHTIPRISGGGCEPRCIIVNVVYVSTLVTAYCIWSVMSSISNLSRDSSSVNLFCHVPWKRDQETYTVGTLVKSYCIWSVVSSISNLNRDSCSLGLFYHVPAEGASLGVQLCMLCMYVCMHVCVCMYVCMYVYACMYMYVCMLVYLCTRKVYLVHT